jgi:hypothetical protein
LQKFSFTMVFVFNVCMVIIYCYMWLYTAWH